MLRNKKNDILYNNGRALALKALAGQSTDRIPVGVFTWGFDYYWKVAGLEPWQLACGGSRTWHIAHRALYERHCPDIIWYDGAGSGLEEPTLIRETPESWIVRDNNTQIEYELFKTSLSLRNLQTGKKTCDPVGKIESKIDADRLIPPFTGWGENYLKGLKTLIAELGEKALVLPHHSPAYICACYAFGFERAMETMLFNPELFIYACERYSEGDQLRMQELANAGAEAVFIADGWASCDIISPEMFERFALPYQVSITKAAHEAGLRIILWNEGNILPVLEREASVGVDAFAFEQSRKGVDISVAKVREIFGPHRCLFGNLDSEQLLMRANEQEIRHGITNQIHMSGARQPFIMCTGSPIPSNVDPLAVDVIIQATREFRF